MAHELGYWPEADDALDRLENDPAIVPVLRVVNRILRRLAADPFDRRLHTNSFITDELGGVCATSVGLEDWYIFWQRGEGPKMIEIIAVDQLQL